MRVCTQYAWAIYSVIHLMVNSSCVVQVLRNYSCHQQNMWWYIFWLDPCFVSGIWTYRHSWCLSSIVVFVLHYYTCLGCQWLHTTWGWFIPTTYRLCEYLRQNFHHNHSQDLIFPRKLSLSDNFSWDHVYIIQGNCVYPDEFSRNGTIHINCVRAFLGKKSNGH